MAKGVAIAAELIVGVLFAAGFVRAWRRQKGTTDPSVHRIYTGVLLLCVACVGLMVGIAILLWLFYRPDKPGLLIVQAATLCLVFAGHILVRTDYAALRSAFPSAKRDD